MRRRIGRLTFARPPFGASSSSWYRRAGNSSGGAGHEDDREKSTIRPIDVSKLSRPWTGLPQGPQFRAERSGEVDLEWLRKSPALIARMQRMTHVPVPDEFWASSSEEGLKTITSASSYYEILALISEHNWRHLVLDAMLAADAPLPHVVYEDLMRALTFSSRQEDPMKQFALPPAILRSILCRAAHYVLLDPDYFLRVDALFRQIETQQAAHSEAFSAFVLCCFSAGKTDLALTMLGAMGQRNMPFDRTVFALAMHPGIDPADIMRGEHFGKARGMLEQERIGSSLAARHEAMAAGVHAGFVLYSLSLRHAKKWELLREAAALNVTLDDRTIRLVAETYERERGRYCGPETHKALVKVFAREGRIDRAAAVLVNMRMREERKGVSQLMRTAFSEEEAEELYALCRVHSPRDAAKHLPLLRQLVENDTSEPAQPPLPPRVTLDDVGAAGKDERPHTSVADTGAVAGTQPKNPNPIAQTPHDAAEAHPAPDDSEAIAEPGAPAVEGAVALRNDVVPVRKGKKGKKRGAKRRLDGFAQRSSPLPSPSSEARLPILPTEESIREGAAEQARISAQPTESDLIEAAFERAAAARAHALDELHSMRSRVDTAWMNPEAFYKGSS